jgi:hypothetical protein
VGYDKISFVEYSTSKKVRLQPDIVEYDLECSLLQFCNDINYVIELGLVKGKRQHPQMNVHPSRAILMAMAIG